METRVALGFDLAEARRLRGQIANALIALAALAMLTGTAVAQSVRLLEEAAFHTSTANDSTVGLPTNNGAFWDGARYWLFYSEGAELRAKTGPTLDALKDTLTNPGGGNIAGVTNPGKSYSVVFGQYEGTWRAWALVNGAAGAYGMYRWDLTETGLANGITAAPRVSAKAGPTHVTLMPNYDNFTVTDLYGTVNSGAGTNSSNRRTDANLKSDTGLNGPSFSADNAGDQFAFGEAEWTFRLTDGYIYVGINVGDFKDPKVNNDIRRDGNFGNFWEWKRDGITSGTNWGTAMQLEREPPSQAPGDFSDMNYARNTSHGGQTDFVQLADGTVYNVYVDNFDTVNGNFGNVIFKKRGKALADKWQTLALNALPNKSKAWHVSLTSDGQSVFVIYVKNQNDTPGRGTRDDAITLRIYDPATGQFQPEQPLIKIAAGSTFERMTTQWRFTDGRLTLLWSDRDNKTGVYTAHAAAFAVSKSAKEPSTSPTAKSPVGEK